MSFLIISQPACRCDTYLYCGQQPSKAVEGIGVLFINFNGFFVVADGFVVNLLVQPSLAAFVVTRPPIGATSCPAARSSGCRSRARCCKSPTGCSSTRRPARSTRPRRPISIACCSSGSRMRRSSRSATARAWCSSTAASSQLKPEAPGRHRLAESKASDIDEDERDLTAASA